MAAKVKQEFAQDAPAIYDIRPVVEFDDVKTWLVRAHVNRLILIIPKTWDAMLKADRTQNYMFMDSMKPAHIIQRKQNNSCVFLRILHAGEHGLTH